MSDVQKRFVVEGEGIAITDEPVAQRIRLSVPRAVVAYLSDLASMSDASKGSGSIAFNSALVYPANTVGARIKSIITGIGEGGPWGDVEALLAALAGLVEETTLNPALLEKINLVVDPAETAGSVNARLAAEAVARGEALVAEGVARAEAIGAAAAAEAIARAAAIGVETDARVAAVAAEAAARVSAINAEIEARTVALAAEGTARAEALLAEAAARTVAIGVEATARGLGLANEAFARAALAAAAAAAVGTEYALVHQEPPFPPGTRIGDVATWRAGEVDIFQRWNGSAWVDSSTNKRPATFRGDYASAGALPMSGNVIGDTARRLSDNAVVVWAGSSWVLRPASASTLWAHVAQEATQRVAGDAAEATARTSLATQMRGAYEGSSLASVTSGLLFEERQARSTADATEVSARQALSTKVTGSADPAALTLATLSSGLLFEERQARSTAVSAEASARTSLATQLRGAYTGSSLAGLTEGLIFDERVARSTADATEVEQREALSATLTGETDPTDLTLATLSSGLLFEERQARVSADSAEASSRNSLATQMRGGYTGSSLASLTSGLLYDERQARSTADATEVTARQALSTKVTGVVDPDTLTLATLSSGLLFDEREARSTAVAAEASARTSLATQMRGSYSGSSLASLTSGLLYDERQARSTADATEVTARQALSTKVTGVVDPDTLTLATLSAGLLFDERQARSTADAAEVTARTTLAAQLRGAYTGTDLAGLTEGLLYQERLVRAAQDESLAQQIFSLSAGIGEQFDFGRIWYFDEGIDGWTRSPTTGTALAATDGWLRLTSTGGTVSNPWVASPDALSLAGAAYPQIRARIRRIGSPVWEGRCYFQTAIDSVYDLTRSQAIPEPAFDSDGISVVTWNMSESYTGANVRRIRLDLSSSLTVDDRFEIDWVAIGRPSPGASNAQLLQESQARATAIAAEASSRQALSTKVTGAADPASLTLGSLSSGLLFDEREARTTAVAAEASSRASLATQMRGSYSGSSLASLTSGLLYDERQARSTADATEVTARQALSTKVTGAADPASLTLSTLSSGLLYDERQARSSADTAEASARTSLATQMRGSYTGTSLASLTSGLLFDERQARSTADATEVTARQSLSTKVTGAADPAALTLSTLSSGLLFDERQARSSADTAEASARTSLATQMRGAYAGTSLAGLTSGLLYDERQARSTADATEVSARQALSTKVTGATDPAALTLASLSSGLLFDERQARSSADASEVSARESLSVKVTGLANPAAATLASLTSGLIFDERVARATAVAAEVSARQELQARFETPTVGNNPTYAAVVTEASARAAADGALAAQWVLKTSAVRSDGKHVFAAIGLAAEAANGTGESQILLAADKLLFVPPGNINATPANMLEVGLVNGVTTLRVPAARIGDATIGAGKLTVPQLSAISANVGTLTAGVIRNASDSFRVDVTNGRTITRTAGFMKVTGAPFGSSSQFIEWYGPEQASLNTCTEANATYYLRSDGAAYFGGTLSAGVLKNAAQSTSISSTAEVIVGPFLTNGGTKSVVLSYSYFRSYACNSNTGSISGTGAATVLVERSVNGGAWVTIGTLTANETIRSVNVDGEPGVPDSVMWGMGGTITVNDNSSATANMRLRGRVSARSLPTLGGTGVFSLQETQTVGIVSTE